MAFYTTKNTTTYRHSAEILELVGAFERCTLPLSEWHGEAFITIAFWYLYLNSLTEAERLLGESTARYRFANGARVNRTVVPEEAETARLLAVMNEFMKIYKGEKSFVALANLVLKRFGSESLPLKNYRRAPGFYPDASVATAGLKERR